MKKGIGYYSSGETVDKFLLIKQRVKGIATNGKPYFTLILQDNTGEIEAKVWEVTEEVEEKYQPFTIVKAGGEVITYRGKLQLRLKNLRPSTEEDGVKLDDFIESAPIPKEEMMEKVLETIHTFQNENIKRITLALFEKYQEPFSTFPAATKNHHEFISGLAYHVVSMLELGESLCKIYPTLHRDLLLAGIILHDMGKVIELSGSIGTVYTVEGNLLGHISIMTAEVARIAESLNIQGEEVTLLEHMVLSHHGKLEYGSPKLPLVREAEMLHFIDNIDAKMNMLNRALDKTNNGEFTDKVFALENRSFYKPNLYND